MSKRFAGSLRALFILPLIAAPGLVGCDDSGDSPEDAIDETEFTEENGPASWAPVAEHGEWTFKDTTTRIGAPDSNSIEVSADALVIPLVGHEDLLMLEAGDVLVGDPADDGSALNPGGFLRKVVSLTSDAESITIQTDAATLADAFDTCDMADTTDLPDFGDMEFVADDGTRLMPRHLGGMLSKDKIPQVSTQAAFDVDGTVLFNGNGVVATIKSGSLSFTPSINLAIDAGLAKGLKSFSAVASGTMDAELVVELKTTQAVDKSFSKQFSAAPITIPIGPIPVQVTPQLEIGCGVDIPANITVNAGAHANSVVSLGVQYTKEDGFSAVSDRNFTLTRIGPNFTAPSPLTASCFIKPRLLIGPNLEIVKAGVTLEVDASAEAAVELTNNVCTFDMTVGVAGKLGVSLDFSGFLDALDKSANLTLFDLSVPLAQNVACKNALKQIAN
ncbi:MAG: hypothetical protein U0271_14650 [Polyangiaceae bacterium]